MKNFRNILMILGVAAFLYACGGGTNLAFKNELGPASGLENQIGNIEWVDDAKNNEWNPLSGDTGGLVPDATSDSKEVERTTSNVQGQVYLGTSWSGATDAGKSINEGQDNVLGVTLQ